MIRRSATLLLVCSLVALPLLADLCAARCGAHRGQATPAVSGCHQASSSTYGLSRSTSTCGHDRDEGVLTIGPRTDRPRGSMSPLAAIAIPLHSCLQVRDPLIDSSSPPGSRAAAPARFLPLRIWRHPLRVPL